MNRAAKMTTQMPTGMTRVEMTAQPNKTLTALRAQLTALLRLLLVLAQPTMTVELGPVKMTRTVIQLKMTENPVRTPALTTNVF